MYTSYEYVDNRGYEDEKENRASERTLKKFSTRINIRWRGNNYNNNLKMRQRQIGKE